MVSFSVILSQVANGLSSPMYCITVQHPLQFINSINCELQPDCCINICWSTFYSNTELWTMFVLAEEKDRTEEEKEIERKEKAKQRRSRTNFRWIRTTLPRNQTNTNVQYSSVWSSWTAWSVCLTRPTTPTLSWGRSTARSWAWARPGSRWARSRASKIMFAKFKVV